MLLAAVACGAATDVSDVTAPEKKVETPREPAIPTGFARFSGVIAEANGTPVAGANVRVPFGLNQFWGGDTDARGTYRFDARVSDYTGVNPVAMVVYKDRYLPRTFYYPALAAGSLQGLQTDGSAATRPLAANEFVPNGAHSLWHIGNASFGGSANSRLQMQTSAKSAGFPVAQWNAQMRGAYRSATITFVARGVQTTSCPSNRVGLYAETGTQTAYLAPSNSDANGGFTSYRMTVTLPAFADGRLMFAAIAGTCGGTDLDDWEFAQVLVAFNP
jgi:hypothetical protein